MLAMAIRILHPSRSTTLTAHRPPLGVRLRRFWQRVTEGMELSQLWSQFETEARASYRLYSRDVAAKTPEDSPAGRHLHMRQGILLGRSRKTFAGAPRALLLAA